MQLPYDDKVDTARLSSCFKNTSATYKFYWFLAILEVVETGKDRITKLELFSRMIANAWYTVNYFHVSFGQQDKIQDAVQFLKEKEQINIDERKENLIALLQHSSDKEIRTQLKHFDNNVPHKFLSPWLGTADKNTIYTLSQHGQNYPPYALYKNELIVQPYWSDYFKRNSGILKDFCYWNLCLFLQSRNPNVPDIPNKLKRPEKRNSLSKHKSAFWDIVIRELKGIQCIYTGKELTIGGYAVEHFVPFQFVAHDQMWNLIPADPLFNSSKGDKLPSLDHYFDGFYELQKEGIRIVLKNKPENRFVEDYLTVFKTLEISKDQYRECIEPMITIAHNNGFQFMNL